MAAEQPPFVSINSPARRPSAHPADHAAPYAAIRRSSSLRERLADNSHYVAWLVGGLAVAATTVAIVLPGSPVLPTLAEFASEAGADVSEFFDVNDAPTRDQAPVQILPDSPPELD